MQSILNARFVRTAIFGLAGALLLAGCTGISTPGERAARADLKSVANNYRPNGARPALPVLQTNSSLGDYLLFAALNEPRVEAAYYDWAASVERITRARSLPDPQLFFESDIANAVQSLMPGLFMQFPGPGKLKAAAGVATAESKAKYFAFESRVEQTAFDLKKAYYQLYFLDTKLRVNRQTLDLHGEMEKLARSQNEVGKATLQDVLREQIEHERILADIANLEDSRNLLQAQFKAALGLKASDPMPPLPARFESTPLELNLDTVLADAFARNPRLKEMEADVRRAEAALLVAYRERRPDFNVGMEVDAKASPVIYNPQLSMSLPLWRDKLAADIAAAQSDKRAAEARLSAEQISLAVDFAENAFLFRESTREAALLHDQLLPKSQLALQVAQSAYLSGQAEFLNVIDAERSLLGFELAEIEARVQRELALAQLSLLVLGQPPANAPLLTPQTVKH